MDRRPIRLATEDLDILHKPRGGSVSREPIQEPDGSARWRASGPSVDLLLAGSFGLTHDLLVDAKHGLGPVQTISTPPATRFLEDHADSFHLASAHPLQLAYLFLALPF